MAEDTSFMGMTAEIERLRNALKEIITLAHRPDATMACGAVILRAQRALEQREMPQKQPSLDDVLARQLTDDQLTSELAKLEQEWDEFFRDLDGMAGSPGESMAERMDEIRAEKARRVISIDGDIGRRHPRI